MRAQFAVVALLALAARPESETILEGRVLNAEGVPVSGAKVTSGIPYDASSETDVAGRYQLQGLEPGLHEIEATNQNLTLSVRKLVTLRRGRNTLDLSFPAGFDVSGQVVDATGAPIAGTFLVLYPVHVGRVPSANSSSDGSFVFPEITDGEYLLTASRAGFAPSVLHGVRVTGSPVADLRLRLGPSVLIRGRIVDLTPADQKEAEVLAFSPALRTEVKGTIDSEGNYLIPDAGPGEWQVTARIADKVSICRVIHVGAEDKEVVLDLQLPSHR